MESTSLIPYFMALASLIGILQVWYIFAHKNVKDDQKTMWEKQDKNHSLFLQRHAELRDDVNKNYVTHDRMTQHVDVKMDAITSEVKSIKEDNKRLEDKVDRVLEKLSA